MKSILNGLNILKQIETSSIYCHPERSVRIQSIKTGDPSIVKLMLSVSG